MILVKIPFDNNADINAKNELFGAIIASKWCTAHGLKHLIDYDWHRDNKTRETHFRFYNGKEQFASLFVLKWGK